MRTRRITASEFDNLEPDHPVWDLQAVVFMRDGSEVHLPGRSLRQAVAELNDVPSDAVVGDDDVWFGLVKVVEVESLGVAAPEAHETASREHAEAATNIQAAAESVEHADKWAQVYAGTCEEVLAAATACLEPANLANGARNKIREHQNDGLPGTPIAIRNFTRMAEEAEQKFLPLYRIFAEACASAQEAAARFIAAAGSQEIAEASMATCLDDETSGRVATVKAILRSNHGPSPEAFVASVEETNALIQQGSVFDDGNIYTPPASTQTDERTCPWCAETIKAAAVICRFCGRDVNTQSNIG